MRKAIKPGRGKTELFRDNSTVEIFWMGGTFKITERDTYQYTSIDNHSGTQRGKHLYLALMGTMPDIVTNTTNK